MVEPCLAAGLAGEAVGSAGAHEMLRYGLGSGEGDFFGRFHVLEVVEQVYSGEIHVTRVGWGVG